MIRLGKNVFTSVLACAAAAALLSACGGGSHQSALPKAAQTPSTVVPNDKLVQATFKIVIPAPTTTSAKARKPAYISQATLSVRINLTATDSAHNVNLAGGQFNVLTQVGAGPTGACSGSGPYTCTISVMVPPGSDTFTFTTYDDTTGTGTGSSHILSEQVQTLAVATGKANSFTITFDANAATITVNGSGICSSGPVGAKFGTIGTTLVTFTVAYTDPATKTIVGPGLPILSINGSTTSGTITGTGGNVNFNITGPQTFTLQGTTGAITDSTVNVQAVQANSTGSSDGLSFTRSQSFKFLTGAAPTNILAVASSSQINFYNIAFGAADVITAAPVPSVTATGSGSNVTVDLPNDLAFDTHKNLVVANGGSNSPPSDVGNLGCFPQGSLTTAANAATTTPTNADDPFGIAVGSDNSSVAVENGGGSSFPMSVYVPSGSTGNYVPAAGARATLSDGSFAAEFQPPNKSIVALPTTGFWSAGTYALALTNASSQSKLVLWSPGGVETQFDFYDPNCCMHGGIGTAGSINDPLALAYDSANSQIIAGDFNFPRDLHFYTASATPTQTAGYFTDGHKNTLIATSPDGHIAVVGVTNTGRPTAQVYDNVVPTRNAVGSGIAWGAAGPPADVAVVHSLFFINNSRLVIAVEDTTNTLVSGVYIYDITNITSGSPAQKAFLPTASAPRAAAYLP